MIFRSFKRKESSIPNSPYFLCFKNTQMKTDNTPCNIRQQHHFLLSQTHGEVEIRCSKCPKMNDYRKNHR